MLSAGIEPASEDPESSVLSVILRELAEGVRFELTVRLMPDSGFRNRRTRPLCDPSSKLCMLSSVLAIANTSAARRLLVFKILQILSILSIFIWLILEVCYLCIWFGSLCAREESNLQPPGPQPSVLSIELRARVRCILAD